MDEVRPACCAKVVSTGGAEGKLLQSVYPYRYLLHDARTAPLRALLSQPTELSPLRSARQYLWEQWRRFWTPALVLLDKTPENLLMAPFLQATFGPRATSFIFVLRHPLSWSLAASKWACPWGAGNVSRTSSTGHTRRAAPPLECVDRLMAVWRVAHERMATRLPTLRSATLLRTEVDSWIAALTPLLTAVGLRPPNGRLAEWEATRRAFLRASHQYVFCYMRGAPPVRHKVASEGPIGGAEGGGGGEGSDGGDTAAACGPASGEAAVERQRWLESLRAHASRQVEALGYSLQLETIIASCCEGRPSDWAVAGAGLAAPVAMAAAAAAAVGDGAVSVAESVADAGGEGAQVQEEAEGAEVGAKVTAPPPDYAAHADAGEGVGLHAGRVALLISSSFLSGFNGMQQRAAQVAVAVGKLGFAVHFVSLGDLVSPSECASAEVAVVCHGGGNSSAQYASFVRWARTTRSSPTLLLLGFTSLTLEASRVMLARPASLALQYASLRKDAAGGSLFASLAPRAERAVALFDAALSDFPMGRPVVFTDDVHYARTHAILAQADALTPQLTPLLSGLRTIELGAYCCEALYCLETAQHSFTFVSRCLPPLVADAHRLQQRPHVSRRRPQRW